MKKNDDNPVDRIKEQLEILKLFRAKEVIDDVLSEAARANLPASRVIEQLLSAEVAALIKRRIERRIRESKLPERKLLADYDFDFQTGVDKQQIMELATLGFAQRKQGVIFAGGSGTGKSHIAKALLLIGCQKNYRCLYTNAATMLRQLMAALADDTLDKKLKYYTKPDILLIDEVGFDRIEQQEARNAFLFFKVIDARYTKNSTWLTTNIDFKALGDYLGDPVVTASIVDRMVHHSIIINIDGPSWRLHESKKLNRPKTGKPKNPSKKKSEKDDEPKV
ncbi:MAG: IS21-like element helper ATPase IstB [Desulfobacteraceae bacterium]|jgi:DNA replication protein DnaC|nr:IS21-like element helper ATPase IstB [Desulfobacteraceae bacterium]